MTEKDKKAIKMMKLMYSDADLIDQVLPIAKALESTLPTSEFNDELRKEFFEGYLKLMDIEDLISTVAPSYSKAFSEEEIDEIIVLFENPVYRLFVSKAPEIAIDFAEIMGVWMANRMPAIDEYVNKFVEKMDKEDWQNEG